MPDGTPWSKISIVTPSLHQGKYIEETIRSVLLQGYPDLEYIVIDGGSTDGTCDIIMKYSKWLAYWVSEPDRGQSHAINKGFDRATGSIFGYINSDDLYEMAALGPVASAFTRYKEAHLIAGRCLIFGEVATERFFDPFWPESLDYFLHPFGSPFPQPACLWTRFVHDRVGGFDESLHFSFDREFFLRIGLAGYKAQTIPHKVARYRAHFDTKTRHTVQFYTEAIPVIEKHAIACGLTEKSKADLLREVFREIDYFEVFAEWKTNGRLAGIRRFLTAIIRSPSFFFQRKVLGQGRRLLFYSQSDVPELQNL